SASKRTTKWRLSVLDGVSCLPQLLDVLSAGLLLPSSGGNGNRVEPSNVRTATAAQRLYSGRPRAATPTRAAGGKPVTSARVGSSRARDAAAGREDQDAPLSKHQDAPLSKHQDAPLSKQAERPAGAPWSGSSNGRAKTVVDNAGGRSKVATAGPITHKRVIPSSAKIQPQLPMRLPISSKFLQNSSLLIDLARFYEEICRAPVLQNWSKLLMNPSSAFKKRYRVANERMRCDE
ncbi:hypothetical protein CYMTET_36008, partial [Cymbomonas tetramitiformis]